jgi:arsenite transporter
LSLGRVLATAARRGRLLLVLGLLVGIGAPTLAEALRPWLPTFVAAMLFLAALRIGLRQAIGAVADLRHIAGFMLLMQLVLPLSLLLALRTFGIAGAPLAVALVLMLAAPPISGSPNLTVLTGNDPAPALRLMIVGTAALPLTVLPVLLLLPELGTPGAVMVAAVRLLAIIAIAALAAFALRGRVFLDAPPLTAIDGLSALTMALMVIALMSAVGPALIERPAALTATLAAAFAANFGLQVAVHFSLAWSSFVATPAAWAISAGNRNIALFLASLPTAATDQILLFIGCYQIPMYLTPVLLSRLHRHRSEAELR